MKFQSAVSILSLGLLAGVQGRDRPFNGGAFGDRAGFPGFEPEYITKTCDAEFACERRNNDETGILVCRETYHPITAASQTRVKCIDSEKAFESDECGCCGDVCPEELDFLPITCPDQDIAISRSGGGRDGHRFLGRGGGQGGQGGRGGGHGGGRVPEDAVVVCRELYNPFTGVLSPVTIPIDPEKSLEGDDCGCCNNECPDEVGSQIFDRPDQVELDWCAADETVNCTLHGRRGGNDGEEEEQGVFVCRSMTNVLTGVEESQPLCIPTDRAWSTDDCGCCGLDCPERPETIDIECTAEVDQCERRNGESGVFVCRDLFHPQDASLVEVSLCIDSEKAWATDDCGCCTADCPVTPEGGFASEDSQLLDLTSETTSAEASVGDASGAGAAFSMASAALIVGSAMFGI